MFKKLRKASTDSKTAGKLYSIWFNSNKDVDLRNLHTFKIKVNKSWNQLGLGAEREKITMALAEQNTVQPGVQVKKQKEKLRRPSHAHAMAA